jgi:hypothetical protein
MLGQGVSTRGPPPMCFVRSAKMLCNNALLWEKKYILLMSETANVLFLIALGRNYPREQLFSLMKKKTRTYEASY